MVRQIYANLGAKSRENGKTFELTSMVSKKPTITLEKVVLYLVLPTRGYDVFKENDLMDMDVSFPPTKQYQLLFLIQSQ
jgi:hypothetical protein